MYLSDSAIDDSTNIKLIHLIFFLSLIAHIVLMLVSFFFCYDLKSVVNASGDLRNVNQFKVEATAKAH